METPPQPAGPWQPPDLPLSFRGELVPHVFAAVRAGWSVALVGPAGLGLSNALRFLAEPGVAAHHLAEAEAAAATLPVLVEADRWLDAPAVLPELARALLAAARAAHWPRADRAALQHLAQRAAASTGPLPPAGGPLAEALGYVRDKGRRVVFLFDDFDHALRRLPGSLLRELRALRDANKYHLAYVLGLRREPAALAAQRPLGDPGAAGADKFVELFDQHTFPLRPYAPADARVALERKALGWQPPLAPGEAENLQRVTGGHAKLLVTGLIFLGSRRHLPWSNVERGLLADPAVAEQCQALWNDLAPGEQLALWRLAREQLDDQVEAGIARLRLRGLVVGGPPGVFSSLFEAFVAAQPEPAPAPAPSGPASRLRDPAAQPLW
jgi:hypothetical protein